MKHNIKYIIGIDFGSKMGWSVINATNGKCLKSGVEKLDINKHQSTNYRFVLMRKFLKEKIESLSKKGKVMVTFEAVELAVHKQVTDAYMLQGYLANAKALFEEMEVDYRGFSISAIKKFATGKSNATKEDMYESVLTKYGLHVNKTTSNDESDAIHVSYCLLNELSEIGGQL